MTRDETASLSTTDSDRRDDDRGALLERQALLLEVGLALSSELSLPAVLQRIIDLAAIVTDARYGALGVLGPNDEITDFVTTGLTDEQLAAIGGLPVGRGILGVLISEPRPLRLRHIADDPRSVGFPPSHPPMRSFLGAPVSSAGRVFGNIYLTEKRGAVEFSEEDERALVVLASQAAIAIENARLYEESQERQRVLEAVREITSAILGGAETDEILQIVACRARELVAGDLATIVVPVPDDPGSLQVRVADGEIAEEIRSGVFPVERSVSGAVMGSGEPELIEDVAADERVYQPIVRAGNLGPAMFVPLASGTEPFGTLAVANAAGRRPFHQRDLRLIETFAEQASVAMQYGRVQRELQRLTVIEDRERIAKELHDGAIQSLFAVGMSLQGTASIVSDPRVSERIAKAVDELDGVIRDLRGYIFELRPSVLAGRQVHDALRQVAAELEQRTDVVVVLDLDANTSARLVSKGAGVVQLVRESLSNVARHAQAQTCRVAMWQEDDMARIEVDDDGRGFDVSAVASMGNGLVNLRNRAGSLGGRVEISSTPGEGTTVSITVPMDAP